jgi:hypothetical protein
MELHVSAETINQVIRSYTGKHLDASAFPRVYRTALRPSLEALLVTVGNDRCRFVRDARILYGYRNADLAKALGIDPTTVSKIFCNDRRHQAQSVPDTD